jgi:hypothetical protein
MRKPKASTKTELKRRPEDVDPDAIEFEDVDWEAVQPIEVELDPALVERIRAHRLKPLTLRVGADQIAEARRVAARTGAKYQAVLRRWLAEGASRARQQRMRERMRKSGR